MFYTSTRNNNLKVSPMDALISGIASNGGLFVPETFPNPLNLKELMNLSYKDLAVKILSLFFTDFSEDELKSCAENAYDEKFSIPSIVNTKEVGNKFFIELFHGETSAFKDMALSILPHLLSVALKNKASDKKVLILTATSGDTGKAALEAFKNIENLKIFVLYPENGVSNIQKMQMQTQEGNNVCVLGIKGNFDDCQNAVKNIFNDKELINFIGQKNTVFSSANSINIGRLMPQIVYYFYSYFTVLKEKNISDFPEISITVPTGNFGNILAAYYAKLLGLPVKNLICASNENCVLTDFGKSGIYDKNRTLILSSSPSMDILISSNLERFLYHLSEGDSKFIKDIMTELKEKGKYQIPDFLSEKIKFMKFYSSKEKETFENINSFFKETSYLLDPHTAVANCCEDKYEAEFDAPEFNFIASTASPYKFSNAVLTALKENVENLNDFQKMERLNEISKVQIPKNLSALKNKPVRFNQSAYEKDIPTFLKEFVNK